MKEFFETDFDIEEPAAGHQDRFLQKLRAQQSSVKNEHSKVRKLWTPILAVAASLLLIVSLIGNPFASNTSDLASVSPKMKQTQEFYSGLIKSELDRVEASKSPQTEAIINDALTQLEKLDKEYNNLREDLKTSGKDKRVIFAMVSNLQQRIDLLKNVMSQIDKINELKTDKNENNII
ncbi:MAG: DUF4179 domain-containing protein [Gillisia sp.]